MENSKDLNGDNKRFGIFNDSFPPILDGVTLTVENYAHWLTQKGKSVAVVTPWNPESIEFPYEVMRYFSIPIFQRKPYRYGYPKLDPFIWRRLSHTPFKLVHAHCPFSSGRLAVYVKKKQGVPLIGTFHSKYREDLKQGFSHTPWMIPIIMKRILQFFNTCDEVWIPQAEVEETVREYGYNGPLEVVDNGIDYKDHVAGHLPEFKKEARRSLGIEPDSLSLLFVGQHIREKGIMIIADTLAKLKGKIKFTMNFVGDGYARKDLEQKIEDAGLGDMVHIIGIVRSREELARYYAASDLFIFPSFYDNAPLVLREAAALGTPGILPKGSTASNAITDGENGFMTGCNATDYAEIIMKLAADRKLITQAGINAGNSIVRSWEDVVEEVNDRYSKLLKRFKNR